MSKTEHNKIPELQSTTNLLKRVLDKIHDESKALSTARLAVVISVTGFILMSFIAGGAALYSLKANLVVESQERYIREVTDEVEVWQIYSTQLHADLQAHGFEVPPLPEE